MLEGERSFHVKQARSRRAYGVVSYWFGEELPTRKLAL